MKQEAQEGSSASCHSDISSHSSRATVVSAQVTAMKTPAEVVDAIRRQSRTRPVEYSKSPPVGLKSGRKPAFRALITGVLPPTVIRNSQTMGTGNGGIQLVQHGKGTPASDNIIYYSNSNNNSLSSTLGLNIQGIQNGSSSSSNSSTSNGYSQISPREKGSPRSSLDGSGVGGSGGGGYSVVFDKHGNMTKIVNNTSAGHRPRPLPQPGTHQYSKTGTPRRQAPRASAMPRLRLTHVSDYPDGFNRSLSLDVSSPRPKNGRPDIGGTDRETAPGNSKNTTSSQDVKKVLAKIPGRDFTLTSSSAKNRGLQRSKTMDETSNVPPLQRENSTTQGMTSTQLADKILRSSDLGQISQLFGKKLRYAEFIEEAEPHRLSGEQVRTDLTSERDPSPRLPTATTNASQTSAASSVSTSPLSSARSSSPRKPKYVPAPGGVCQPSAISPSNTSGLASATTNSPGSKATSDSSQAEPEIDYDKPIKIIIETNDNETVTKLTRPILKSVPKVETSEVCTYGNDTNNNHVTPSYLSQHGDSCHKYHSSPSSVSSGYSIGSQLEYDVTSCNRDKGRLVRFRVHHTIHEFAPSDPVNSGGYY
ncbi:putative GPI-anchored protein pfl2 [Aplysia californica]|uniref:GPI-anchored protein pfl2 n=1 Tax=Aplysia californica TaxID=6500 RepID=A0ABM0JY00_APLCA|nr:putative GPI-anchored protein pfl2 [Aplysia californica]